MRSYAIILFLFSLPVCVKAAGDSSVYIHYDLTNGLPSNNVYMCMQDHLGYMWFATEKGVVKYDGYKFKVFTTADGLPNEDAWKLLEDSKGRIWVYSISHKFGYILNDKYYALGIADQGCDIYPSDVVGVNGNYCFLFTNDRNFASVFVLNDKESRVIDLSIPLKRMGIRDIIVNRDGNVYGYSGAIVYTASLSQLLAGNVDFHKLLDIPGHQEDLEIRGHMDVFGKHFLTFKSNTIIYLSLKTGRSDTLSDHRYTSDPFEKVYVMFPGRDGIVLITNRGLYYIDSNFAVSAITSGRQLFKFTQVSSFLHDGQGNRWYSTATKGVYCEPALSSLRDALPGVPADVNYVGSTKDDRKYWWEDRTETLYSLGQDGRLDKMALSHAGSVKHVTDWVNGRLLMAYSFGMGVTEAPGERKDTKYLKYASKIPIGGKLYPMDNGTHQGVLRCYRVSDTSFVSTQFRAARLNEVHNDSIISTIIDNDRYANMLVDRAYNRLILYNPDKVFVYDMLTKKGKGINTSSETIGQKILTIQKDDHHNYYIQSENGIVSFDQHTQRLSLVKINADLRNSILRVQGSKLVVAGHFGLAIMSLPKKANEGFRYLPNAGSLLYNIVYDVVLNGNDIILKTDRGFQAIGFDSVVAYGYSFENGNDFSLIATQPFYRKINAVDTIEVNSDQTRVSFSVINLFGSGTASYKYRIRDISGRWNESASGEILLDGKFEHGRYYEMEVVAKDDLWVSNTYSIFIYRQPYWYQTTLWQLAFWAAGILFFAGLVLITIYFTRRYVAKANEKRQQLTDLELRAIHSQINPHFIFNTLSTALYFINRNEMEAAYEHVNKFSHLLRSYLKSSQERYISLDEEIEMLKKYIELQQSRFGEKFHFILTIDNKLPVSHIMIPSLLLQPLVENAINHGLFHKKGKGILKIAFEQGAGNDELICTIEDNGVGRKAAEAINMANEFKRESYGSKLTQGLIDIFEQYEQMNIDISYEDKQEPETGTVVKLLIRNIKYVTA